MNIKERINEDLKTAMKARDAKTTSVLRMILSDMKYAQAAVSMQSELSEQDMQKVVSAYHKKLGKSAEEFPEGDKKQEILEELKIVERYLPQRASAEQIETCVVEVLGSSADRQFGAIMKAVMAKLSGAADGKLVSEIIKKHLNA